MSRTPDRNRLQFSAIHENTREETSEFKATVDSQVMLGSSGAQFIDSRSDGESPVGPLECPKKILIINSSLPNNRTNTTNNRPDDDNDSNNPLARSNELQRVGRIPSQNFTSISQKQNLFATHKRSYSEGDLLFYRESGFEFLLDKNAVSLDKTYWHMKYRQWKRIYRSSYGQPKQFNPATLIFYLMLYTVYLSLQIFCFDRGHEGFFLEFIVMGFISFGVAIVSSTYTWMYRLIFFELYSFFWIFFVFSLYERPDLYVPILTVIAGLVIVTLINFYTYPIIVRAWHMCTGELYPKLIVSHDAEGRDRYEMEHIPFLCWANNSTKCVYEGPLKDGKPEGWGVWIDTSFQGELLHGYWAKGIPIGPFESKENDTRNILVNLRIIFATNRGGWWWLERTALQMGVASVETCVSGHFYSGYPVVKMLLGPLQCQCVLGDCNCVSDIVQNKHYKHIDDEKKLKSISITIDKKMRSLNITGFRPLHRRDRKRVTISLKEEQDPQNPKQNDLVLSLDSNWLPSTDNEGILFIHGLGHSLRDALKRFGQFLALGHFPSYLKPFVFNWPGSSSPLLYWRARSVATQDIETHKDLCTFLQSMYNSGIRRLHIMCHSMGTRMFLSSFSTLRKVLKQRPLSSAMTPSNSSEHLLMDENDVVQQNLLDSSLSDDDGGIFIQNLILLNPDYELDAFRKDYFDIHPYCGNITVYADHRDVALKFVYHLTKQLSLGSNVAPLVDSEGNSLDIDVIDTGDLDRNINAQYHSYFNINKLMVDDLWELIVTGKRAEERTSRLKPHGQVYRFTIVPSSVVIV